MRCDTMGPNIRHEQIRKIGDISPYNSKVPNDKLFLFILVLMSNINY